MIEVTKHHMRRNELRMRLAAQEVLQNGKGKVYKIDFKRELTYIFKFKALLLSIR
jgi:hypothetical protein